MADLTVTTTDRGFDHHAPVASRYGGEVRVSESSNAEYPGLWLHTTCPQDISSHKDVQRRGLTGPGVEASANLHAHDAWQLARQLAATVVGHYQGDARPDDAIEGARAAIVQMTGWSPAMADTMLRKLRRAGLVLIDVGPAAPGDPTPDTEPAPARPARLLDAEPEDGALVVYVEDDGSLDVDTIHVRDDKAAHDGEYAPGAHWFAVGEDDEDGYPSTWAELAADGQHVARLYPHQVMEAGVAARLEWGVFSAADGSVYSVAGGDHDTAIREAALLVQGVDGDPERTPEPGSAPASRYVLDTPRGRVEGPWSWPVGWTPPPAALLD